MPARKPDTDRLHFRMPEEAMKKLRRLAIADDRKTGAYARRLLIEALQQKEQAEQVSA